MATTGDRLNAPGENVTVQKGSRVLMPPARSRPTTPADQEADTVQVWPHLVVIEFLGAVIITINMVLLATLFNGPLEMLANPDKTPNPSKAPWYFLNLQELLLHMNPALAGVIVPTIALGLIAAIPYVDRGAKGLGIWFYNDRGAKIAIFSVVYSTLVCAALIALDATVNVKPTVNAALAPGGALNWLTSNLTVPLGGTNPDVNAATAQGILLEAIAGYIIPIIMFIFFPVLLVLLLRIVFRGLTLTEAIIGLFTGFVTVYWVLTFVGTAMRGPGMVLFPPFQAPPGSE